MAPGSPGQSAVSSTWGAGGSGRGRGDVPAPPWFSQGNVREAGRCRPWSPPRPGPWPPRAAGAEFAGGLGSVGFVGPDGDIGPCVEAVGALGSRGFWLSCDTGRTGQCLGECGWRGCLAVVQAAWSGLMGRWCGKRTGRLHVSRAGNLKAAVRRPLGAAGQGLGSGWAGAGHVWRAVSAPGPTFLPPRRREPRALGGLFQLAQPPHQGEAERDGSRVCSGLVCVGTRPPHCSSPLRGRQTPRASS